MAVPNTCSQSWVTVDSSRFSDDMSDEVTIEQQRKELAAMVPPPRIRVFPRIRVEPSSGLTKPAAIEPMKFYEVQ